MRVRSGTGGVGDGFNPIVTWHTGGFMSAGVEVVVEGLTKSFGQSTIWSDVTLTLPQGEVSVLLGPSGTG